MKSQKDVPRAIHIAVWARQFTESNSGLEFLKYVLVGIVHEFGTTGSKISLFVPLATFEKSPFIENTAMVLLAGLHRLRGGQVIGAERLARKINGFLPKLFPVDKAKLGRKFEEFHDHIDLVFYGNSKNLLSEFEKRKVHVILPATTAWEGECPLPWVGYVADCQHKYFPEYFAEFELERRDQLISSLMRKAQAIMVNSQSTKKDLRKFYGGVERKIFDLPFAPVADPLWLEDSPGLLKKYNLPKTYFLISNRFWRHKSHATAWEALSLVRGQGYGQVGLVCTGEMRDYRDPHIENTLRSEVKKLNLTRHVDFLGLIDKREQIEIMKKAVAVLQPTLFEGGPGGGAVYNAAALGRPAIVSDIPVNLELRGQDNIIFFKARSAEDLAEKMKMVLERQVDIKAFSKEELMLKSKTSLDRLGHRIKETIDFALQGEQE